MKKSNLLSKIQSPMDIKALSDSELKTLCQELRTKIIETVSVTGGHLSSNLGVVELTVILHKMFDSPNDKIVWDVGHQCYAHKLLTGRKDRFDTLRQEDGIAGFPRPWESEHDPVVSGHASTSLSTACGLARAELLKGTGNLVIAVIGDGALTGGMAYEALNNATGLSNLIIVLNYNEMSISKTVGGFARYLSNMRTHPTYLSTRKRLDSILKHTPVVGNPIQSALNQSKYRAKQLLYDSNLFTDFGFSYLGLIDGHSLTDLQDAFHWAQETEKPALIQVCTVKGKGYCCAEENPGAYHGVPSFNLSTGKKSDAQKRTFSSVFGEELTKLAEKDSSICAITAAMKYATGLQPFAVRFPTRFFDVGIAEEHAATFAAGLAAGGQIPVFAVYSTFLQRSFDQLLHDAAIANLHVVLGIDRAGIVGDDGETHQGVFDVSFLSSIPHTTLYAPADFSELRAFLEQAVYQTDGLTAIRYPRGGQRGVLPNTGQQQAEDYRLYGEGEILIITYGVLTIEALAAVSELQQKGISCALLKLGKIHPIPEQAVALAQQYSAIFFFEEGIRSGGIGQQMADALLECGYRGKYRLTAIDNCFVEQSSIESAWKRLHLDCEGMVHTVCMEQKRSKTNQKRKCSV